MIVCSCKVISKATVEAAAERLAALEPGRPVTAGRLFRALGAKPQCGTCLPLIRRIAAAAGATVTCPEPLAMMGADGEAEFTRIEIDIVFDATGTVA